MFGLIAVVLIVLWLLGFFAFHVAVGLIHILLVVGIVLLVLQKRCSVEGRLTARSALHFRRCSYVLKTHAHRVSHELTLSFVPDAEQRLWRTVMRRSTS